MQLFWLWDYFGGVLGRDGESSAWCQAMIKGGRCPSAPCCCWAHASAQRRLQSKSAPELGNPRRELVRAPWRACPLGNYRQSLITGGFLCRTRGWGCSGSCRYVQVAPASFSQPQRPLATASPRVYGNPPAQTPGKYQHPPGREGFHLPSTCRSCRHGD